MNRNARKQTAPKAAPLWKSVKISWMARLDASRPAFGFALRFAFLLAALTWLSFAAPCRWLLHGYLAGTAWLASGLLHWIGIESRASDTTVLSTKYSLTVAENCSALEFVLFFVSAVLAFPTAWNRKWPGLGAPFLLIPLVNLLRVASLFTIGSRFPRWMDVAHVEIWPLALIVITLVGWLTWIQWATGPGTPWRKTS
jgi:exosortase/archaeosortase family protein